MNDGCCKVMSGSRRLVPRDSSVSASGRKTLRIQCARLDEVTYRFLHRRARCIAVY
jgi:hypothetical protein